MLKVSGLEPKQLGWIAVCLLGLVFAAYIFAGFMGRPDDLQSATPVSRTAAPPPLPVPVPTLLKPMAAGEAIAANEAMPFSSEPIEVAHRFRLIEENDASIGRSAAIDCLAAAIYYEAAVEREQGQRGVAQVVLNRTRHPAFPASICEVVYQGSERRTGCQFSFTCDGSLGRRPNAAGWARARRIASDALDGKVEPSVGMATHYHADYVLPYWASSLTKIAALGRHIFYRWPGYWGKRAAFTQSYAGEKTLTNPVELASDVTGPELAAPSAFGDGNDRVPLAADLISRTIEISDSVLEVQVSSALRADESKGTLKLDEGERLGLRGPQGDSAPLAQP